MTDTTHDQAATDYLYAQIRLAADRLQDAAYSLAIAGHQGSAERVAQEARETREIITTSVYIRMRNPAARTDRTQ